MVSSNQALPGPDIMQTYQTYKARLERAIKGVFVWSLKSPMVEQDTSLRLSYWGFQRPLAPSIEAYGGSRSHYDMRMSTDSPEFRFISIIALYFLRFGAMGDKDDLVRNHWVWNELLDRYTPPKTLGSEPILAVLQLCWQNLQLELPKPRPLNGESHDKDIEDCTRRARTWARPIPKTEADEYNKRDEALDRLIFLLYEVFPSEADPLKEHTFGRIEQRISSQTVKPGDLAQQRYSIVRLTTEATWVLECLNHHVTRTIAVMDVLTIDDIKRLKDLCSKFLLQDYTFAPTFSKSNPECLEKFWHMTPSAIVGGTLLGLAEKFQCSL